MMVKSILLFIVAFATGCSFYNCNNPYAAPTGSLQAGLDSVLSKDYLATAVKENRIGIALVDITAPSFVRTAEFNSEWATYAASLPKILILFAYLKRVERGDLPLSSELLAKATEMIRYSSNEAATELINIVGREFIEELALDPQYKLYNETNGGLWVGKEYARTAAWKLDPVGQISHSATAASVARFYYLLDKGRLLNPGLFHKFQRGLGKLCGKSVLFRKSGSWGTFHSDSAIVERLGQRYVAVALINDLKGDDILEKLIKDLDQIMVGDHRCYC